MEINMVWAFYSRYIVATGIKKARGWGDKLKNGLAY